MKLNNINMLLAVIWLIVLILVIINRRWSDIVTIILSLFFFGTYLSGWFQGRKEH